MHGDFSRWFGKIPRNQVGILAQEGRILLDADVNAHALLGMRWQDLAARSAFGARIAAIPADNLDAWKVTSVAINQGTVTASVLPGAAWADGLLVEIASPRGPVSLTATPLRAPLQEPVGAPGVAGTRDAVILEVWRHALNGYQATGDLIEPALGGPDTAERIETAYALRLYRMRDGETCRSLDLNDRLETHGRLSVTIAPTTMTAGDCPVVQGGGYTGLEHDLYRVEIADIIRGEPMFKWSQWNGGLVGRGEYDATTKKLTLRSGDQAILRSGLTSFYLEALVYDTSVGHWRVAYGVPATLDINGEIDLSQGQMFGAPPDPSMVTNASDPSDKTWFVRIWNGVGSVADFSAAKELRDGIVLAFSGTTYVPGDYWTFPVRAGLDNPPTLLDKAPPFGIHHHRVPLAEIHWTGNGGSTIEDCRVPLHPITATDGCCTYSVGDGITSHGEFTSVQAAIDALPGTGGRVCVLPGTYTENVQVLARRNIEIVGCGPRSRIIAKNPSDDVASALPAIYVLDTSGITIEKVQVEAGRGGIGILLEEDANAGSVGIESNQPSTPFLENMRVADCTILAGGNSGIEIRGGRRSELVHNQVSSANKRSDWALITLATKDARVERNLVTVTSDKPGDFAALGGIWLRGGCVEIDVVDNEIMGGAGHGIMLGHAEKAAAEPPNGIHALKIVHGHWGFVLEGLTTDDCAGCGPGPVTFPPPTSSDPPWVAGDPLEDIRIRNNDISLMGISGIGVIGFFPDARLGVIAVDRLSITDNRIIDNIIRGTASVEGGSSFGYGAISLAEVSDLVILDNEIRDNGTRTRGQVCGICVQHGIGVEVSRNRIYNNGPTQSRTAPTLPHGGVWLNKLVPPFETNTDTLRPAAVVHDNVIEANTGPGLFMDGLGHFSVVANTISTRSSAGLPGRAPAMNVSIVNYSGTTNVRFPTFTGLRDKVFDVLQPTMKFRVAGRDIDVEDLSAAEIAGANVTINPGLVIGAVYTPPPGSTLFANNQVITYSPGSGALSAVNIWSLADVNVSGNHFLTTEPSGFLFHPTPVVIVGATTHVQDNRFIDQCLFASVSTWGGWNITTNNTADHCILVTGVKARIASSNIERFPLLCGKLKPALGELGINVEIKS